MRTDRLRTVPMAVIIVGLSVSRCGGQPEVGGTKLVGEWTLEESETDGVKVGKEGVEKKSIVFRDRKFTIRIGSKVIQKGDYETNDRQNPAQITFSVVDEDSGAQRSYLAIYVLKDDDHLVVCSVKFGKRRPLEFKTEKGDEKRLESFRKKSP